MVGKIFITRSGYDPEIGKHVKDPYLGDQPTMGACRPDIRRRLKVGDHIFVISGRVKGADQFVMGGFEIAEKITMREAFDLFPEQRLRRREDGQLTGNVILDAAGHQHRLDDHKGFERRVENYVVGTNSVTLSSSREITAGRHQTIDALREILHKSGASPFEVVGHYGANLTERQIIELREWLTSIKKAVRHRRAPVVAVQ